MLVVDEKGPQEQETEIEDISVGPDEMIILITAPLNSAEFAVHTERCSPTQLWAASQLLHVMGNTAYASMISQPKSPIILKDHLRKGGRNN